MKLGELISTLEAMPQGAPARFDFGLPAGPLMSWRGVYAQLTLSHGEPTDTPTVADVLADAKKAVGRTFTGYKGGDYDMSEDTPVWADDYGRCSYIGLMGVSVRDGGVVFATADLSDYRGW